MGRPVFVPARLAAVARVLTDEMDKPPKRGDRSYVIRAGCWNDDCMHPIGEGHWHAVRRDEIEEGDIWKEWDRASFDDGYDPVWKFKPPTMEPGTLRLVEVDGGTRIFCEGCDLDNGDFGNGETDFAEHLRELHPGLFDGRTSGRSGGRVIGDEVAAFLRELLADGEKWSDEVKRKADDRGISAKTLRNVRERAVQSRRLTNGKTIWRLRGEHPADPHAPSPQPYARTRARFTPDDEGHMGTGGHEGGAEPQSHMPSEGTGGHEAVEPHAPTCPSGARGFSALERPHAPSGPHAPTQNGDIVRAREAERPLDVSCVMCGRDGTQTAFAVRSVAEGAVAFLVRNFAEISEDMAQGVVGGFARRELGCERGEMPGGEFLFWTRLCEDCADRADVKIGWPDVPTYVLPWQVTA